MDNEDTQPDPCNAEREMPRLAPSDSFIRALVKLQVATDALGAAILASDVAAAAAAASDACSSLLAAIAVFRRFEPSEEAQCETSRIDAARYALRTNHRALEDLYARAQVQLSSNDLRRKLDELRIALTLAMGGGSVDRDTAGAGRSQSTLALNVLLQQMGRLAVRVAELETAIEARATGSVVETMRTVTAEWHVLRADFCLLQAAALKDGDILLMPTAMQVVRRSVHSAIGWSLAYVAQVSAQEERVRR